MSNIASRISDTEEEVTKAISAGQEALECMKKESEDDESSKATNRENSVKEVLDCVTELEKEARKALKSDKKMTFEFNKEGVEKAITDLGKVKIMQCYPKDIVASEKT